MVLAMGEGHDAVFLAKKGFKVEGIDISAVALRKARRLARENRVFINPIIGNLKYYKLPVETYDLVVNVDYFRAELINDIKKSLKPGGYVVFQNFLTEQKSKSTGLSVPPRFLVEHNQLKELFKDFEIIVYNETNNSEKALAQLIARKP